jgi:hypothetical protein
MLGNLRAGSAWIIQDVKLADRAATTCVASDMVKLVGVGL